MAFEGHSLIRSVRRTVWALFSSVALVVAAACGGDAASSGQTGASGQEDATASADGSGGARQVTVDMDEIFPPGDGRDLVLNNCQNCHTWVPIVVLQMNEEEWARWARDHRPRVEALSDEDFDTLYDYLVENFNPDTPVPELPQALLNTWTSY